jgi:hypothetical protein
VFLIGKLIEEIPYDIEERQKNLEVLNQAIFGYVIMILPDAVVYFSDRE